VVVVRGEGVEPAAFAGIIHRVAPLRVGGPWGVRTGRPLSPAVPTPARQLDAVAPMRQKALRSAGLLSVRAVLGAVVIRTRAIGRRPTHQQTS
jgi:hypothetical protein